MFDAEGCDGAVLCYGGYGMGKLHTLYETSSSYNAWEAGEALLKESTSPSTSGKKEMPLRTARSVYETHVLRTPGLKSGHSSHKEGLLVRIVHNIFRRMVWKKFQSPVVHRHVTTTTSSSMKSSSPDRDQRLQSPDAGAVPWSRMAAMELQVASFAVTHSGEVVDLLRERERNVSESNRKPSRRFRHLNLGENEMGTPVVEEAKDDRVSREGGELSPPSDGNDKGDVQESMSTPTLKRTKAVAMAKEMQKQMKHTHWVPCTNTVDFEALLKPVLDVCHKHEEKYLRDDYAENAPSTSSRVRKSLWSSKKDDTQFVVTQIRLAPRRDFAKDNNTAQQNNDFFSKIAFVTVLPGETMTMEGPILTGTHLSASMLRLRAVLDALTGIGSKNQALLRANASLANMLSAPLGSPRLLGSGQHHRTSRPPFVSLLGCVSQSQDQINQVSGFLSFAERAELATLLHGNNAKQPEETTPSRSREESQSHPAAMAQHQPSTSSPLPQDSKTAAFSQLQTTPVAQTRVTSTLGSSQNDAIVDSKSSEGGSQAVAATETGGGREGGGGLAMVPLLTPPSARAVSKMVWPTASPATFSEGLHDFAHIKGELESIWSVMREAERYHEEALATAEVELHEAEAATRRAGARANEMKKIIQSLKDEIQNQKDQLAKDDGTTQLGEKSANGSSNAPPSPMLGLMEGEIKQLKEQVLDEQALRREAEAAVASLDDECARLNEKLNQMSSATQKGSMKSRNVRIQCALQTSGVVNDGKPSTSTGPTILGHNSNSEIQEDSVGREESSHQTASAREAESDVGVANARCSEYEVEKEDDLSAKPGHFHTPSKSNMSGKNSSQSTPTLIAQKEEPRSSDSEIMSRDELLLPAARVLDEEVESRPPINLNLKEMPQKQTPEEENAVSVTTRKRHSTLVQDVEKDKTSDGDNHLSEEESNPLVLIIAVNMYKGHTEKINIYLQDTSVDIAKNFVKKHNLPEKSVKNLEKLINKNLEKNNIVIGKQQVRSPNHKDSPDKVNGSAPIPVHPHTEEREKEIDRDDDDSILSTCAGTERDDDHQVPSDPPTPTLLTPAKKDKTKFFNSSSSSDTTAADNKRYNSTNNNTPKTIPASPATSDPGSGSRPLRPVDMYRFIN